MLTDFHLRLSADGQIRSPGRAECVVKRMLGTIVHQPRYVDGEDSFGCIRRLPAAKHELGDQRTLDLPSDYGFSTHESGLDRRSSCHRFPGDLRPRVPNRNGTAVAHIMVDKTSLEGLTMIAATENQKLFKFHPDAVARAKMLAKMLKRTAKQTQASVSRNKSGKRRTTGRPKQI